MTRRTIFVSAVLVAMVTVSFPAWGGDPAGDSLDKGYQAARRGYWQEAMAQFELASRLAPGNAEAWSNLGVALEAVGRWDEAGVAYRKALEIEPGNSKIRKNVALYNEFYASYVAVEDAEEKESEDGMSAAESDVDGPSGEAPSGETTEEGADDVS